MADPFFSICIPQYNRTSFLVEAIRSIQRQDFRDVEVCISDDCSTDGREEDIRQALEAAGLPFRFQRQPSNGRYDRNLRAAMDLARGTFLFLLGNDDALRDAATLGRVHDVLEAHPSAGALITNFEDYATGTPTRRVHGTRLVGSGPDIAVRAFRTFSFVSGVVLRRTSAAAARTTAWDGSEMYQMYIGCRVIASGGSLVEADICAVRKDITVAGESVDSFATRPREALVGIPVQPLPITRVAALVADAIAPHAGGRRRRPLMNLVVQYYGFLCPYWLLVYRRLQSWRYAAGLARAFAPSRSLRVPDLPWSVRAAAWLVFVAAATAGLCVPVRASAYLFAPARRLARAAASLGGRVAEAGRP